MFGLIQNVPEPSYFVIRGLDPRIQETGPMGGVGLDCRIKSGNDEKAGGMQS
jgi:hypothetical protein